MWDYHSLKKMQVPDYFLQKGAHYFSSTSHVLEK